MAVFGDLCLDAYWLIDSDESEHSVETDLPVRRVREQHYSLGGAANVIANVAALGVKKVYATGLVGNDLFGRLMVQMLRELGADVEGMQNCQTTWQTMVFGKPHLEDAEQNRIDFGGFNVVSDDSVDALGKALERIAGKVDIIILNQQVPAGASPRAMIERINEVIACCPDCMFIVDSRHRAHMYQGAMLKLNAHEAASLSGHPAAYDELVTAEQAREYARDLFRKTSRAVFVTRGENGIVTVDEHGLREVPGIQVIERTDPVGAGDTTVAGIAAVLGSGGDPLTAAKLAIIAASVTVRKIQTTGTANPEEILAVGPDPDYVYAPELADGPRRPRGNT